MKDVQHRTSVRMWRSRNRRLPVKKGLYMDTLSWDNIPSTIRAVTTACQLPWELEQRFCELATDFLGRLLQKVDQVGHQDVSNIREFYAACKRRYSDLTVACESLLTADSEGVAVFRRNASGELRQYLIERGNSRVVLQVAGCNVYLDAKHPGCYAPLFKAVPELVEIANLLKQNGQIAIDEYAQCVRHVAIALCTLGKAYEDIRGGQKFIADENRIIIERSRAVHHLDYSSKWWGVFLNVKEDILVGSAFPARAKPYVRDICRRLHDRGEISQIPFSYEDFHISMKSTGTKWHGKSVPGLYASILEPSMGNNELINYEDHYNEDLHVDGVECHMASSLNIKQHKLDMRNIKLGCNPLQDQLSYYHNRMVEVLRFLRTDCTFDQAKGKRFASKVSSPRYRARYNNCIYCLDISKATETIDQSFQKEAVEILLGSKAAAEDWLKLMTPIFDHKFRGELTEITLGCGQPQGLKSSFPAFAWAHHIIMLMIMNINGLQNEDSSHFYRVLGDDSIISWPDWNSHILNDYIDACQWINWTVNSSKGYTFNPMVDTVAFAEFAKVRYVDGVVATPIPFRLVSRFATHKEVVLAYYAWVNENLRPVDLNEVVTALYSQGSVGDMTVVTANILAQIPGSVFSEFVLNETDSCENTMPYIATAYVAAKLKETLVAQFFPDHMLEKARLPKDIWLGGKWEELLLPLANDPQHKYWQVLYHNEELISALNGIFGDKGMAMAAGTLHLSDKEMSTVLDMCECIMDMMDGIFHPIDEVFQMCDDTLRILNARNPRSGIKKSTGDYRLLGDYENLLRSIVLRVAPQQ